MSRIGRQVIMIPQDVEVRVSENTVTVKGPKGSVSRVFKDDIIFTQEGGTVKLSPRDNSLDAKMLWGTYASHLANMIEGAAKGFQKKLVLEGIGYRASLSGKTLTLHLGFTHPIALEVPPTITASVDKNIISILGADKEEVGQFAARIRAYRPPEPYKGKGVRYENEVVRRKEGKKVVA